MDPAEQLEQAEAHAVTYHRFTLAVKWFGVHAVALIAFLVIAFATSAGFWSGLIVGLVLFGAGVYAMRLGLAHSSEGQSLSLIDRR